MFTTTNLVLAFTTITTGLIAGLFYGYACSVNIGLNSLPDSQYLQAMQSINKEIQNPVFFLSFMGSMPLLIISTYGLYRHGNSTGFYILLTATILYLIGPFGLTVFGNVPLNEALANFNIKGSGLQAIAAQRQKFEHPWNMLHLIRTIAAIITFMLAVSACFTANHKITRIK